MTNTTVSSKTVTPTDTASDAMHSGFYAVGRPTVLVAAPRLAARLGVDLTLVTETFQRTGSFKFRAAYHVASNVEHTEIITASSGNFGQAMACACQLLDKRCTVVMPDNAVQVKVDAVRAYGGRVDLIDTSKITREGRVAELAAKRPDAYVASAYDDPLVIEGNATLGYELAAFARAGTRFDVILVPIGGGGLSSGLVRGLRACGDDTPILGAEPALGGNASKSLRKGARVVQEREPQSLADGARTRSLGVHNWAVLERGLAGAIEVSETNIAAAVRLLFGLANMKAEPTAALTIGALLEAPERLRGRSVCCILTGGNADPSLYARLLTQEL